MCTSICVRMCYLCVATSVCVEEFDCVIMPSLCLDECAKLCIQCECDLNIALNRNIIREREGGL